jgi:hypothetical protein
MAEPASDGSPWPPPKTRPRLAVFSPRTIWRVHAAAYRPGQFHPGGSGDARFSPLCRPDAVPIPTLYGASTLAGALMETVFHEVPTPPAEYILDIEKLREAQLVVSRIRPRRRLQLVDLSAKGLKRIGLRRTDLIDTPVDRYSGTRAWAEWFHEQTDAKGLLWTSRQDDDAKALVLFGDRVAESALRVEADREPVHDGDHLDALLAVAEHIGIERIHGL